MSKQAEIAFGQAGIEADFLASLFETSDQILIKKLSNNDRLWTHQKEDSEGQPIPGKRKNNQAGVYIPHEERDSGFFPPLELKERKDGKTDEIWERFLDTRWPQASEEKRSRLVNYRSKSQETHITVLPRALFIDLNPASFLVMGRVRGSADRYDCLTIDSASDEASLLVEMFGLGPDFSVGIFEPESVKAVEKDKVLDFAEQVIAAWLDGTIAAFAAKNAVMPSTIDLARMAQAAFLRKYGLGKIDPFALGNPGDALREISRSIEWDLFREYQRRERSVELVRLVLGDKPQSMKPAEIIRQLIDELPAIDALRGQTPLQRKNNGEDSRPGAVYRHRNRTVANALWSVRSVTGHCGWSATLRGFADERREPLRTSANHDADISFSPRDRHGEPWWKKSRSCFRLRA